MVRALRFLLVVMLLGGLASPVTAQAASAKAKTKIVFVNVPEEGYYSSFWWLDSKSAPAPVAKARLMRYRASSKKWVAYPGQTVVIKRNLGSKTYVIAKRKTDKKGYFKFAMSYPDSYTARFAGNKRSRSSSKMQRRTDWVEVRTSTVATSTPVGDAHSRISVATDLRYNPYIPGGPQLFTFITAWNLDAPEKSETLFEGARRDLSRPRTGNARFEFSCVVPNAAMTDRIVGISNFVLFEGGYFAEEVSDDDPWFGSVLSSASGSSPEGEAD